MIPVIKFLLMVNKVAMACGAVLILGCLIETVKFVFQGGYNRIGSEIFALCLVVALGAFCYWANLVGVGTVKFLDGTATPPSGKKPKPTVAIIILLLAIAFLGDVVVETLPSVFK